MENISRGKRVDNGEWIYGYYIKYQGEHYILLLKPKSFLGGFIKVHFDSVGRHTGKKDKEDTELYAGDLTKDIYVSGYSIYVICFGEYDNDKCYDTEISGYGWYTKEHAFFNDGDRETTIREFDDVLGTTHIGNIIDDPRLLETK